MSVGIVRPLLKLQCVQHGAPGNSFTVLLHCLQLQSAAGSRVLFEKLTAHKLAFMEPECSSPCSQQPTASLPVCLQYPLYCCLLLPYTNRYSFTRVSMLSLILLLLSNMFRSFVVTFIRVSYSKNTVNVQYRRHSILQLIFYAKSLGHRALKL